MSNDREFLFKLCLQLGYKSVAELENSMSFKEFAEWGDYYSRNPFLVDRVELQLATLSEMIYAQGGGSELQAIDFMPSVSKEEKESHHKKIKHQKVLESLKSFGE